METILVLTDFSYTAFNAARYAVNLANQLHAARVILYHAFTPFSTDTLPPFASEVEDTWSQTIERLNALKVSLEIFTHNTTQIDLRTSNKSLQLAIETLNREEKIGLVVMGSTGNNKLKRLFIGSNTISLSDTCTLPLLIVPPDTEFENIERTVFACDLHKTNQIPVRTIKNFLDLLHSELSVLYFDEGHEELGYTVTKQTEALHKLVNSIKPEFSYVHSEDVVDDILDFSAHNDIQLIIIIHKKPHFLQSIFYSGTTNKLAYYSHFPLLILKPSAPPKYCKT